PCSSLTFCSLITVRPTISSLLPYTTLFRSGSDPGHAGDPDHVHREPGHHRGGLGEQWEPPRLRPGPGQHDVVDPGGGQELSGARSEEHTSELQSRENLACRLLLEKTNPLTV